LICVVGSWQWRKNVSIKGPELDQTGANMERDELLQIIEQARREEWPELVLSHLDYDA
jgi:hypothetical protein